MNTEQLNDDCLKAILVRLPVKEFIQNVRLVSRRFRDATEFSLKDLVAREPISLEACFGCGHELKCRRKSPKISLAGVNVAPSKFDVLELCNLLPLVSNVSLCSDVEGRFKVLLSAILKKLTGVTTLEFSLQENRHFDANNDMAQLKRILESGALVRLQGIRICMPCCDSNLFDQIHLITTLASALPLRKIEILGRGDLDGNVVVILPRLNTPADLEIGISHAIRKAENVTELCFSMHWNNSYLQLEQLLIAMQHGSLKRLLVKVDWHNSDARCNFGMDRRVINSILPVGCQITQWNITVEDNKSMLTSIVISGRKLSHAAAHASDVDEDSKFWVRLWAR